MSSSKRGQALAGTLLVVYAGTAVMFAYELARGGPDAQGSFANGVLSDLFGTTEFQVWMLSMSVAGAALFAAALYALRTGWGEP